LNCLVHRNLDAFSHLFREDGRDKLLPSLNLVTVRSGVAVFTLRSLFPQGKRSRYSLVRRLGESQSRHWSGR
jgi:hypothetical protein